MRRTPSFGSVAFRPTAGHYQPGGRRERLPWRWCGCVPGELGRHGPDVSLLTRVVPSRSEAVRHLVPRRLPRTGRREWAACREGARFAAPDSQDVASGSHSVCRGPGDPTLLRPTPVIQLGGPPEPSVQPCHTSLRSSCPVVCPARPDGAPPPAGRPGTRLASCSTTGRTVNGSRSTWRGISLPAARRPGNRCSRPSGRYRPGRPRGSRAGPAGVEPQAYQPYAESGHSPRTCRNRLYGWQPHGRLPV